MINSSICYIEDNYLNKIYEKFIPLIMPLIFNDELL